MSSSSTSPAVSNDSSLISTLQGQETDMQARIFCNAAHNLSSDLKLELSFPYSLKNATACIVLGSP